MSDMNVANMLGAGAQGQQVQQMGVPQGMGSTHDKFGMVLNKALGSKESTDLAANASASILLMNLFGGAAPVTNSQPEPSTESSVGSVETETPSIDMTTLGKTAVSTSDNAADTEKTADTQNKDVKNNDAKNNNEEGSPEAVSTDNTASAEEILKDMPAKAKTAKGAETFDALNAAKENLSKEKPEVSAPKLDVGDMQTKDAAPPQSDNNTGEKEQDKPAETKTVKVQPVEYNNDQGSQQVSGAEKAQQNAAVQPHNTNTENAVPRAAIQINDHTFSVSKLSDNSIEVRLEPDGLGSVKIHLNMENGTIHADIRASDEAARVIIEKNLHDIVKALTQEGLTVGDFSVSLKDKGSHADHKKQHGADNKKGSDGDIPEDEEIASVKHYGSSGNSTVNIFA